jgi:hypothetical protein
MNGVTVLALSLGVTAGCSPSSVQCDCADPAIRVRVPPERASLVSSLALSGTACAGASATCETQGASGCTTYAFRATAQGKCEVDVYFSAGPPTFHAEVTVLPGGCCGGFYADPPSAADIDVPSASDAGGAG